MLASPSPQPDIPLSPAPSSGSTGTLRLTSSRRHLPSRSPARLVSRSPSPEPPTLTPSPAPRIKVVPPPPAARKQQQQQQPQQTAAEDEDVFSLSDAELSNAYTFAREIGFGNWGSAWLCKRKLTRPGEKLVIKLVHRSKTPTTAARVRALWNEMKVVRSLPARHPSIIDFESFIITPSYALVTMPYCERLMPVGIDEDQARKYFGGLIDGVRFLHDNFVAHNDIKPANVLLSAADVPVLIDFGFATRWDPKDHAEPFLSTISWGTPEYLSASRARGHAHDERTSDVWSLGITCFEILMGRTPFEQSDQEQFSSADELEVYYARTVAGAWIGEWAMSPGMEELLKGMTHPVDSMRLTANQAVRHHALQPPPKAERYRSNLPRPISQVSRLPAAPSSPPRAFPSSRTDTTDSSTTSASSTAAAAREKKTASPPKKVVCSAAGRPAATSSGTKEVYAFLRYEKASDRLAAPAAATTKSGQGEASRKASQAVRLASPSRDRLKPTRSVKVKAHGSSPRKAVVASSPRRSRVPSNASRATATTASKIAYHRPTPPSSSSPAPSPTATTLAGTGTTTPDDSRTSSSSDVSALVESGGSSPVKPLAPTRRAKADVLRSKKRPERILIDVTSTATSSASSSSRQPSVKVRAQPAAGKENAPVVERQQVEARLKAASPKAVEILGVKHIPRVPVPSEQQQAKADSSLAHARHRSTIGLSGMAELQEQALADKARKHQTCDGLSLRPSASFQTLTPRVSEASLPSIDVAQSSEDARLDTKLDRISLWVRNVDQLVEETRDSIHARNVHADASRSPRGGHKPTQSESYLSTPSRGNISSGLQPLAGPSHVLSPSQKVTPSRTVLNGITVFLPNGRGLADVPESISGSPALSRSLSNPAHKVVGGGDGSGRDDGDAIPDLPARVYETIHFAGSPAERALRQVSEDEPPRSTRLKRSRSKLLALFQAAHDPKSDPALTTIPTERLSFLKFPPPDVAQPHAPIKHRSSLLRLKSIKSLRSVLTKDKESAPTRSTTASQIPVPTNGKPSTQHRRQPSAFAARAPSPSPPPPTPSSFYPSEPLTPHSPAPTSPPPVEVVSMHRVETHQTHFGTLTSRKSLSRSNTLRSAGGGGGGHKASGSLSEGLRSLFSPTPPPAFSRDELEREHMRSGTPNTMASSSAWTEATTTTTTCSGTVVGTPVTTEGYYGGPATTKPDAAGGAGKGRFAMALMGLSFGRRKKGVVVLEPALEYEY